MKVLFVETRPLNGLGPLARLASNGHSVDLVTSDWEGYAAADPEAVDACRKGVGVVLLPHDADGSADAIESALTRAGRNLGGYDAILTLADGAVENTARLAQRAGRVHATPEAVARAKDKVETRRMLAASGLPQPAYAAVDHLAAALRAAAEIGYPVVVKPARLSGSRGVSRADDDAGLEVAFAAALGASAEAGRAGDPVLVEEFVAGLQVSAEILSRANAHLVLGFTDRLPSIDGFTERGGVFPAAFSGEVEARRTAAAALETIGFTDGAAHVEMRLLPRGPVVIEINPRLAGFVVPELVEAATGLDLYDALVRIHAGEPLPIVPERLRFAALRPIFAVRTGVLRALDGSLARAGAGVVGVYLFRGPGSRARIAASNRDRLGAVIAVAGSAEEAGSAAEAACANVKVVYSSRMPAERAVQKGNCDDA